MRPFNNLLIVALNVCVFTITANDAMARDSGAISQERIDSIVHLIAKDQRRVEFRYIAPKGCDKCPLIVFSHGANAAYDRYDKYLLPMSEHGYRIAVPNHIDSEEHPNRSDFAPTDYLPKRIEDFQLIVEHYQPQVLFAVGHSFGALIAQLVAGAEAESGAVDTKRRPQCVITLSPPGPIEGYINTQGWGEIKSPQLVVTGTQDIVPSIADNWQDHLVSYIAAPAGQAVALVYEDMNHYMNGAYGRETDSETTARARAMSHLVASSHTFLQHCGQNGTKQFARWSEYSTRFVEAMSK